MVIPALNEEKIILSTIQQVIACLQPTGFDVRVVVVDDGSTDKTWALLEMASVNDPRVVGVKLSRNFGHDAALFCGIKAVEADVYITMDADGQHPFAALPSMLALWQKSSADIVNAVKRSRGEESAAYKFAAKGFGRLLSMTMGDKLGSATEFKLLSRRAAKVLMSVNDFHIFYRALVPWIGLQQVNFEFDVAPSMRGDRHWRFSSLVKFALSGLVMFSDLPMRLFLWLGAGALLLCAGLFIKLLIELFAGGVEAGYSTLLVLLMLNLALTMISFGIIGMYVRATMQQAMGRPRAIIQSVTNSTDISLEDRIL